jgi:hypothetical protein
MGFPFESPYAPQARDELVDQYVCALAAKALSTNNPASQADFTVMM